MGIVETVRSNKDSNLKKIEQISFLRKTIPFLRSELFKQPLYSPNKFIISIPAPITAPIPWSSFVQVPRLT